MIFTKFVVEIFTVFLNRITYIGMGDRCCIAMSMYVILYETPRYGAHHFSLSFWNSSETVKIFLKKHKWIDELHQKQPLSELDAVILAMNSATASKMVFERHVSFKWPSLSFLSFAFSYALSNSTCYGFQALCLGVVIIGCVYGFVVHDILYFPSVYSYLSEFWITIVDMHYIKSLFDTAWINIQICCGQILFWPILLQVNDLSRVEYAEKAALHKHSMWSSLAVDVLLVNLIGFSLLFYAESDCLWLKGVHAGFKLNTELAGVLGMISLHAIQIWSALWFFMDALLLYLVKGLAMLGILFGMTVPAAFIRDMIVLVTLHVSTLHWVMSLLYSQQITSISSFMVLVQVSLNQNFLGRKWNPLRQRLDSYEYTLKQHIVGSLIFTPLLLLLPTSVFYIFFTMMNSSISLVCMLIEVVISIMHATPYINIELRLVRRRRFPPGIWFEIVSCHGSSDNPPEIVSLDTISSPSKNSLHLENISGRSHVLVAILHSNFLTVGQIVIPHYIKVFTRVSRSYFTQVSLWSSYREKGEFSSIPSTSTQRFIISSTFGTKLPSTMPWMFIPFKEYWCVFRNSTCKPECDCHLLQ
ncbi:N-acetylglucosaminyl transferase component family protein / Gpi1 family protein [Citrus sinensis]|nr:N-acetylglucosaminyl transferase component family protein / Gpi1 family protein [Citrus sinensis]